MCVYIIIWNYKKYWWFFARQTIKKNFLFGPIFMIAAKHMVIQYFRSPKRKVHFSENVMSKTYFIYIYIYIWDLIFPCLKGERYTTTNFNYFEPFLSRFY